MAGAMATLSSSHGLASSSSALLAAPRSAAARRDGRATVIVSAVDAPAKRGLSRRQAVSLTALSLVIFSSSQQKAQARDIPLFGFKKAKKLGEEVVQEVKDLVKEGESEAEAISGAVRSAVAEFPGAALSNIPSVPDSGLSPAIQAGVVVGAEVVAVLVASTVVNGLVSSSK